MKIRKIIGISITLFLLNLSGEEKKISNYESMIRPFVEKYCIKCHGPKKSKGSIHFDKMGDTIKNADAAEHWQEVVDSLNTADMPPKKEKQPEGAELENFLRSLSKDTNEASLLFSGTGKSAIRRLNKREYLNTIYDTLGVRLNEEFVIDERAEFGFDTIGKSLNISRADIEVYLKNGRTIARDFIQLYTSKSNSQVIPLSSRMVKGNPSFMVRKNTEFLSGKYFIRVKLWKENDKPVYLQKKGTTKVFAVTGTKEKPQFIDIEFNKIKDLGGKFNFHAASIDPDNPLVKKTPTKEIAETNENDNDKKNNKSREKKSKSKKNKKSKTEPTAPKSKEPADPKKNDGTPENKKSIYSTTGKKNKLAKKTERKRIIIKTLSIPYSSINIESVSLVASLNTKAAKGFFAPLSAYALPGKEEKQVPDRLARPLLHKFALLMFRGDKPQVSFLNDLENLFYAERKTGKKFWEAVIEPMALVLTSPEFIYHNNSPKLNNRELANRLAYFVHSSAPDKQLLMQSGRGWNNEALEKELHRALESGKAMNFYENFHRQWLELDRYDMIAVNSKLYPLFHEVYRSDLRSENVYFIKELIEKNLPIRNLIKSDFIMANDVVAFYYGLPWPNTTEYKKIMLPKGSPYGGILTSATVMSMTSTGLRSSAVERGAFILRKLLDDPPLAAPANVPELKADEQDTSKMTAKELLARHTKTPQCAACHRKMDALGFTLEGIDAVGKFRNIENRLVVEKETDELITANVPLDINGSFDGQDINGHTELQLVLIANEEKLAKAYVKALLSYALGRTVGFAEKNEINSILEESRKDGFRMRSLIANVVKSKLFQSK